MKKLKDQILPLFLTAPIDDDDEEPMVLRGVGAAKALLRAARAAHARDEINLGHIQHLCTFDWILSPDENLEVQAWLKCIWTAAGVAGASAASRCSARQSSSSNDANGPSGKKGRLQPPMPRLRTWPICLCERWLFQDKWPGMGV